MRSLGGEKRVAVDRKADAGTGSPAGALSIHFSGPAARMLSKDRGKTATPPRGAAVSFFGMIGLIVGKIII